MLTQLNMQCNIP